MDRGLEALGYEAVKANKVPSVGPETVPGQVCQSHRLQQPALQASAYFCYVLRLVIACAL